MIIDKLYLKKFGKFENKEIDFSSRLNIFMGKNEAVKSTISTALKLFSIPNLTAEVNTKRTIFP